MGSDPLPWKLTASGQKSMESIEKINLSNISGISGKVGLKENFPLKRPRRVVDRDNIRR